MTHYDLIAQNKRKSWFIIAIFMLFVIVSTYVMSYAFNLNIGIVEIAIVFSIAMSFTSYWWSDKIILSISRARPATREEFFDFYTIAENLSIGQRMKTPKLYVIDDMAMNAFATGRDPDHAVICATTGILKRLNRAELEGVIAHELSHVENYDIRLMSIVVVLVGLIALLSDWMLRITFWGGGRRRSDDRDKGGQLEVLFMVLGLVFAILSPVIAQLIQLAISRRREFLADASGVGITKNPEGLAKALEKISQDQVPLAEATNATAHLFIANPFKKDQNSIGWLTNLFNTHPPIADRIQALRS